MLEQQTLAFVTLATCVAYSSAATQESCFPHSVAQQVAETVSQLTVHHMRALQRLKQNGLLAHTSMLDCIHVPPQ